MTNRREFLKGMACAGFATAGCCPCCFDSRRPQIALQLYSLDAIFWKSPEQILAELKASGFDGVEFAGVDGRSAKDLRKLLGNAGLSGAGTHVNGDVALVGKELRKTLDFYAEVGIQSIVTPHAARKTADEYRAFGATMGRAAEVADAYGIRIGVHTAPFHFNQRLDGQTPWELITGESSPLLQQEIDVGNVLNGGCDPVAVLKAGRGRHFILHAKEYDPTPHGVFGEKPTDGGPNVPWDDVLAETRDDSSVRWWTIEAESILDSTEPAKENLAFLRSRLAS